MRKSWEAVIESYGPKINYHYVINVYFVWRLQKRDHIFIFYVCKNAIEIGKESKCSTFFSELLISDEWHKLCILWWEVVESG